MDWAIWFEIYENGEKLSQGVWHKRYKIKRNAIRMAKKYFDTNPRVNLETNNVYTYKWIVSQTNPWKPEEK